ncbi:MAG: ATP-dependent DNA helicase RecG [Gammaproteobacteria bacterium]|nr:ATP-dependent DNA helicase RecG [Gammaproteobacteria bacterium]
MNNSTPGGHESYLPVTSLKGVGPRVAERLARLDIHSIEDLLFHLPYRYEDRTRITPIGALRAGNEVVIQGKIELTEIKFARRRMLLSRLSDGTGFITLRFFHFNARQQAALARGVTLRCYGEVRLGSMGLEMTHPEYQYIDNDKPVEIEQTLTPVYSTTEGLHQLSMRNLTEQALAKLQSNELTLSELIPADLLQSPNLPTLGEAVQFLHRPPPDIDLESLAEGKHPMQKRLVFEELLAHTLSLRQLRSRMRKHQALALQSKGNLSEKFLRTLEFQLTRAQRRVINEIEIDLQAAVPMQRLVQGDVGSGKTIVALMAVLHAVESGYQAAVMAPTEILAEQHYHNFDQWLTPLGIKVAWLSGKLKASERKRALQQLDDGEARVAVGTHALFQEEVKFQQLALVVVDEQHRFGVHQRLALREKGKRNGYYPHQLIMTATPIPRTLSMAVYADLDCSVIDELPPGRKPVETVVIPDTRRDDVVARVHRACQEGKQAYWVCTLIEESEVLQCQAAEDTAEALAEALPEVRVGLVHGRLKSDAKEKVMQAFKQGDFNLLVATTVIEVGVDVPNASLMIIENAERLGLAQLHQLRGRVGRGNQASACVLMYHGALSEHARERLGVMRETGDGFEIARKDLELRGPGEVLGTRQTGMLQLRVADLQRDQALLPEVSRMADQLLDTYPERVKPLVRRWIGSATRYGNV